MPPVLTVQLVIWATCYAALKQSPLHLLGALIAWVLFTVIFVRRTSLLVIQLPNIAAVALVLGQDIPDAMADATIFGINIWALCGSVLAITLIGSYLAHQPVSRFRKSRLSPVSETLPGGPPPAEIARRQSDADREAEIRAVYAARGLDYRPAAQAAAPVRPEMHDFGDYNNDGLR